jgi:hypothetical protein
VAASSVTEPIAAQLMLNRPSAVAPPASRAQKAMTPVMSCSGTTKASIMIASGRACDFAIQPSSSVAKVNEPIAKAKSPSGRGLPSGAA